MDAAKEISCWPLELNPGHQLEEVSLHISLDRRPIERLTLLSDDLEAHMKKDGLLLNHNSYCLYHFKGH